MGNASLGVAKEGTKGRWASTIERNREMKVFSGIMAAYRRFTENKSSNKIEERLDPEIYFFPPSIFSSGCTNVCAMASFH